MSTLVSLRARIVLSAAIAAGCSAKNTPDDIPVDASIAIDAAAEGDGGADADASLELDGGIVAPIYYPPRTGDEWETVDPVSVGWNVSLLEEALDYAESLSSTAVIILYRGRILVERYWQGWDLHRSEPIFSSSKSVTSFLIGLLKQDGQLQLDDRASLHLGAGWSTAPATKEDLITLRHLLTMTSGLDDNLAYVADAGTVWFYNTPAYHELFGVIAAASGISRDQFADTRLHDPIGMQDASWRPNNLDASARDMARFGLLILSDGAWDGAPILSDPTFLFEALSPSQSLNQAYGYLWWLNGQASFKLPGNNPPTETGPLIPDAPADLVGALGAGDKKIYVVKSMDLVVIRHGGPTGSPTLARSSFDNVFWQKIIAASN